MSKEDSFDYGLNDVAMSTGRSQHAGGAETWYEPKNDRIRMAMYIPNKPISTA
jgi:hypothetical protein